MSKVKAGGTAKNLTDSKPKYLGVKLSDGQKATKGAVIIRQRGTRYLSGKNTGLGRDHTIFATKEGVVKFSTKRKTKFNSKTINKKSVEVI